MPATENISEALIREYIVRAVGDVFKTMLGRSVQLRPVESKDRAESWPPLPPLPQNASPQVVGTVGFLGDIDGLIYLYFDEAFAKLCTANMLGFDERDLSKIGEEAVNDAIGELTNMVVGGFKNGLCDAGYPCKLTIPSILRGANFCIEPISTAQRHVFCFECRGHKLVADILMKTASE